MRSEPKEPRPARAPRVLLCEPQYHCSVELVTKRTVLNQHRGKCVLFHNMNRLLGIWLAGALAIQASDLALVGARIYPAPDALPIKHGSVLIRDGRIVSVLEGTPKSAVKTIDCNGLVITAGFWNCHVHFSEPKWENARTLAANQVRNQVREMFTQWGFTTVFDTGSMLANTKALARRIEAGEFPGPMILSAGEPSRPRTLRRITWRRSSCPNWKRRNKPRSWPGRGSTQARTPSRFSRARGSHLKSLCPCPSTW